MPSTSAVASPPPSRSSQVQNWTHEPPGDSDGANSSGPSPSVSRRGMPSGSVFTQIRPSAWNTAVFPSGVTCGQRTTFTSKVSPASECGTRSVGRRRWLTFARKGIGSAFPVAASTRWRWPRAQITSAFPSGVQE